MIERLHCGCCHNEVDLYRAIPTGITYDDLVQLQCPYCRNGLTVNLNEAPLQLSIAAIKIMNPAPPGESPIRARTPEGGIQARILEYLKKAGIDAWRNNTRRIRVGGRLMEFGKKGSSDIIGLLRGGRFLAIEVKAPGEHPTREQKEFLDMVRRRGGVAILAYSLEDVTSVLSDSPASMHP
jgi:hypothetical protein